jgi:hypothetical protein
LYSSRNKKIRVSFKRRITSTISSFAGVPYASINGPKLVNVPYTKRIQCSAKLYVVRVFVCGFVLCR